MSLLVVGSVAYDSVRTPVGARDDALGGSAAYFSISASYFAPVSMVAVIGDDFRPDDVRMLEAQRIDTSGLERRPGRTFRWSGVYGAEDVDSRETLDTQLNVFADFSPTLSAEQSRQPYLFLANIDPGLQLDVLQQMHRRPELVALDTMNFWIDGRADALSRIVESVDVVLVDEGEARALSSETNLIGAAREIMSRGPSTVVVKRGSHGVLLFRGEHIFAAPAFPLEAVADPTGAGDSFAGGFMGYLASTRDLSHEGFVRATVLGSVMGSFTVESFSTGRLAGLTRDTIDARFRAFTQLSQFRPLRIGETLPWRCEG